MKRTRPRNGNARSRPRRTGSLLLGMTALGLGIAMAALGALSQPPEPREELAQLLLTQEELIEVLEDTGWVIKTVDRLNPEPEGGVSAVATYANPNRFLSLVIGLIRFETPELLDTFVAAILEAPQLQAPPRDLRAEAEETPELLPEPILQETQRAILLYLERDQQQVLLQRNELLLFVRLAQQPQGTLTTEERTDQLLRVGARQLQKVLDFCAERTAQVDAGELPSDAVPAYCVPLEEETP